MSHDDVGCAHLFKALVDLALEVIATLSLPLPWLSSLALKVEASLEVVVEEMTGKRVVKSLFGLLGFHHQKMMKKKRKRTSVEVLLCLESN